jgi:hypothetical protein
MPAVAHLFPGTAERPLAGVDIRRPTRLATIPNRT